MIIQKVTKLIVQKANKRKSLAQATKAIKRETIVLRFSHKTKFLLLNPKNVPVDGF